MERSKVGGIILIVIGVLFLLGNLGMIPRFGELLYRYWPVILIAIGVAQVARK